MLLEAAFYVVNQPGLYRNGRIGEGHQSQHAAGRADGMPAVREAAQMNKDITGEQWFFHLGRFALADSLDGAYWAVTGDVLVTQVFLGACILPGLALHDVPLRRR